ncbi:helix-turn-helix transcriptional regulator [Streptomyces sp. NPDC096079]|uniref:helix-turn-helix domain-containing protein n=1 Tax=Streptomyces sp. NPDC096079 TaxID=3155820 RepID=UPI00332B09D1
MSPSPGTAAFQPSRLHEQRERARLSVEALAVLAAVSPETVRRAEQGRRKPSARVLKALADALKVPMEELAPVEGPLTLKQIRQREGITQKVMATKVGVSAHMVSRVENGVYGVREPTQWATAYGVTPSEWVEAWTAGREDRQKRIRAQTNQGKEEA